MISWNTILVEIKSRMACQLKGDLVLPDDSELKKGFKVSYILIEKNILEVLEKKSVLLEQNEKNCYVVTEI